MYIAQISLRNVKAFKNNKASKDGFFSLNLSKNMNILIGPNGSGKSTFLEALAFVAYGHDKHLSKKIENDEDRSPYNDSSELRLFVRSDSGEKLLLNYLAEPYNLTFRLRLFRLTLNGTTIAETPTISAMIGGQHKFQFSESVNIALIDLHRNSSRAFYSYRSLDAFRKDRNRATLKVVATNAIAFSAKNKDDAVATIEKYFGLRLRWNTLPNQDTPNRTFICRERGIKYHESNEATGYLWIMNLLLGAIGRQERFLLLDEPELFLHPRFQERLFVALQSVNTQVILATHSPVFIDAALDVKGARHFTFSEDGIGKTKIKRKTLQLLNDLGVRGSHMLQSNGIIWVEGPSDRIYLKIWIDLLAKTPLREQLHYSFLYYGGSNLKHHGANIGNDRIDLIAANRNCILVMDRDNDFERNGLTERPVNKKGKTKLQLRREVEKIGGWTWITQGYAIEDYLPKSWRSRKKISRGKSQKKLFEKLKAAEDFRLWSRKYKSYFDRSQDVKAKVKTIIKTIYKWNT